MYRVSYYYSTALNLLTLVWKDVMITVYTRGQHFCMLNMCPAFLFQLCGNLPRVRKSVLLHGRGRAWASGGP